MWAKQVKEIKRYKLTIITQISHKNVMCNIRNTVNITITLYGGRWILDFS